MMARKVTYSLEVYNKVKLEAIGEGWYETFKWPQKFLVGWALGPRANKDQKI